MAVGQYEQRRRDVAPAEVAHHFGLDVAAGRLRERRHRFVSLAPFRRSSLFLSPSSFAYWNRVGFTHQHRSSSLIGVHYQDGNLHPQQGLYWVLPSFPRFYWLVMGFAKFYRVLLGFTGFCQVFMGFTGFE